MNIDFPQAADLLAQLGNETRLRIVRLLVEAGPDGLPVGELQRELDIPASTLSHHISHLRGSGLVSQTRRSTTLLCHLDYIRMDEMIRFLTRHCCSGVRNKNRKRQVA